MNSVFNKQIGVALITVMLIIALATVIAVSMASRQNIDIHRSANVINYEQTYQYILGAEDFSKIKLTKHFIDNPLIVTEDDVNDWKVTFPIEGGTISGEVQDLQAKFNLNSLVDASGGVNKLQFTRFKNLLTTLQLDVGLAEKIVDWIDDGQAPQGLSGVEDNEYLGYEKPYRTADQSMFDISELLLIKDIDSSVYQSLKEFVCVLKDSESSINVNTASAEVITSLDSAITLEQANSFVSDRKEKSFSNVKGFLNDPVFAGLKVKANGLSVTSDFFNLRAHAVIEKTHLRFMSQLQRVSNGEINVVKRARIVL